LPAIPLIAAFLLRKWIPVAFFLSIIVATALLGFWHHNYDLASDAQAAIGLVIIPIMATMITSVVVGIIGIIEFFVRRRKKGAQQISAGAETA
jgi:heme/copper-type cytochrome/quinol oxidase subunit 2